MEIAEILENTGHIKYNSDILMKPDHISFACQTGETSEAAQVICDVSFQAVPGECVVLCGKSKCGKTTLLQLVNGLVPLRDGRLALQTKFQAVLHFLANLHHGI